MAASKRVLEDGTGADAAVVNLSEVESDSSSVGGFSNLLFFGESPLLL